MSGFRKLDFRNSKYQGQISYNYEPHGEGILLDDDLRFILSSWNNGLLNGNTLIFDSHSKYIYGSWKSGLPSGVNVYREGQTILLANFSKGVINGRFMVIFEAQGIMIIAQMDRNSAAILNITKDIKQEDILKAATEIQLIEDISTLGSLIGFIKNLYHDNDIGVETSTHGALQFLGFRNGLGILFDNENFIHKVGNFLEKGQIVEIGGVYTTVGAQEGDFETQTFVTYSEERPVEQLRLILKQAHLRSVTFVNSYVVTKVPDILEYLSKVLKQEVANKLNQPTNTDNSGRYNMNDSLDYHTNEISQNERLKKMRAELYLSIGRPGSQIKPVPGQVVKEFIATEQKQKRQKAQASSKYTNAFSKKSAYDLIDIDDREPTARFETVNYNRHSSPVRNKHATSIRYTNIPRSPATIQKGQIAMWKQQSYRIIQARKSKSPTVVDVPVPRISSAAYVARNSTVHNPSGVSVTVKQSRKNPSFHQTTQIHRQSVRSSFNLGGTGVIAPVVPDPVTISASNNTSSYATGNFGKPFLNTISNIKYEDIKQRRARLLNQYKQIGNKSSPMRVSPFKESPRSISPRKLSPTKMSVGKNSQNTMYGSPYRDLGSSNAQMKQSRQQQSRDIKTISRRIDRSEMLPTRSPVKYSYLNSYL